MRWGGPYEPGPGGAERGGPDQGGPGPGLGAPLPTGVLGKLSRAAWQYVLVLGLLSLVLGVLTLLWPGATLLAAGVLFGVYLLVSGVFQLVSAFGTHATTALRVMAFISGALSILLGLFCFRGALQSVLLLALWIGIGWLFRGITQAVAAASDEAMPARGWQVFLGVVSALAGVVLLVSPFRTAAVLTVLAGCWLLVLGVVEIVTALQIRGRTKHLGTGRGDKDGRDGEHRDADRTGGARHAARHH
ncbi:HdeD family acid-resistance protein [Streptomyces daliensis]|uniref:HdeD family acid-resistance protein n=1 Tax=Streptomyces daliensis TaxID=299421 RepID=A0A8T4IPE9_9ACTN|nr:HdeD family acid-resistance protein [Streptomyces daliensis]